MRLIAIALAMNGLDLLSGTLAGLKNKSLNSAKLRSGLFKKSGYVLCYIMAFLWEKNSAYIGMPLPVDLITCVCSYAYVTEAVSVIENIYKLNPAILPEKLMKFFMIGGDKKE